MFALQTDALDATFTLALSTTEISTGVSVDNASVKTLLTFSSGVSNKDKTGRINFSALDPLVTPFSA